MDESFVKNMPKDLFWVIKQAMTRRVLADPVVASDIIELVSDELEKCSDLEYYTRFSYHDQSRTIEIECPLKAGCTNPSPFTDVMKNVMYRFCCTHKTEINRALLEYDMLYNNWFNLLLQKGDSNLFIMLIQINELPTVNGKYCSVRLY